MSNDALRALADRLEAHTEQMANTSWGLTMQEWNVISNDILLAASTLRAALTPPADGTLGEIRARHEAMRGFITAVPSVNDALLDRGTLLPLAERCAAAEARVKSLSYVNETGVARMVAFLREAKCHVDPIVMSSAVGLYLETVDRAAQLLKDTP